MKKDKRGAFTSLFGVATPAPFVTEGPELNYSSFVVERMLNTGFNSEIVRARHKASGVRVAIKSYFKKKIDQMQTEQILREAKIHLRLHHPNILQLFAVIEDETAFHFVSELADRGDLFTYLRKLSGNRMGEADAVKIVLFPFMSALNFLHERGIMHRDIKPENVLLDSNLRILICDFGLAIDSTKERPVSRLGTLEYMSPEVLLASDKPTREERERKSRGSYGAAADVWSVGVLAYEILTGNSPFARKTNDDTAMAIIRRDIKLPAILSPEATEFIEAALKSRPEERPSLAELLSSPLIHRYVRSLQQSHLGVHVSPRGSNGHHRTYSTQDGHAVGAFGSPTHAGDLARHISQRRVQQAARRLEVASPGPGTPGPPMLQLARAASSHGGEPVATTPPPLENRALTGPLRGFGRTASNPGRDSPPPAPRPSNGARTSGSHVPPVQTSSIPGGGGGGGAHATGGRHMRSEGHRQDSSRGLLLLGTLSRKAHSAMPSRSPLARAYSNASSAEPSSALATTGVLLQVEGAGEGDGSTVSVLDLFRTQAERNVEKHNRNASGDGSLASGFRVQNLETVREASTPLSAPPTNLVLDARHAGSHGHGFGALRDGSGAAPARARPGGFLRRLFGKLSVKA